MSRPPLPPGYTRLEERPALPPGYSRIDTAAPAKNSADLQATSPPPLPPGYTRLETSDDQARAIQQQKFGAQMSRAGNAYGGLQAKQAALKSNNEVTPVIQEKFDDSLETVVPPGSLRPGKEAKPGIEKSIAAPIRFPNMWRWDSPDPNEPGMKQIMDREKARGRNVALINPGMVGGQITLVNEDSKEVIATLRHGASHPANAVRGLDALHHVTGEGSFVQQGLASVLRSAATGENKLGINTGYGLAEGGQDLGAEAGQVGGGKPASWMGRAANQVIRGGKWAGQKLAEADAAVDQKIAESFESPYWQAAADERRQDAKDWAKSSEESDRFAEFMKGASPAETKEIGKQAGVAAGGSAGELASAALPTDTLLPSGLTKLAKWKLPAQYGKAAELVSRAKTGAADTALSGPGQFLGDLGLVQPSSYATRSFLKEGEKVTPQEMVRSMKTIQRTRPESLQASAREAMTAAQEQALQKHNIPTGEWPSVLSEVQEKWHSPEAVMSMSPEAKAVREELLPFHYALFEYGKQTGQMPGRLQYDPYHKVFGQNFAKRAKFTQSDAALRDEEAGRQAWAGTKVAPVDAARVDPAVSKLGDRAVAEMQPNVNLPLKKHIENVEARLTAGGETPPREIQKTLENMKNATTVDALSNGMADMMLTHGEGKRAVAEVLRENLVTYRKTDRENFMHVRDLMARLPASPSSLGRTSLGKEIPAQWSMPSDVQKYLKHNDLVLVRSGRSDLNKAVMTQTNKHEMRLPEQFAEFDGMVMPRRVVMATAEAVGARNSGMEAAAGKWAREWDKLIGLNQKRATITLGNPGFFRRNEAANLFRLYGEEGKEAFNATAKLDGKQLSLVELTKEISNAPSRTTGRMIDLGDGQKIDIGHLRQALQEEIGVGHGLTADTMESGEAMGSQGLSMLTNKLTKGKYPRVQKAANAIENARDKAVNAMIAPSKKLGEAGEQAWWGGGLNPDYSMEDGLRVLAAVRKMQRGVPLKKAAQDTNSLFINYVDKAPIERITGPAIPFISYYMGMERAAMRIAIQHPRRFSRVYDIARGIEGQDQARKGGAFDPRIKPVGDQLALNPMYSDDQGRMTGGRIESPASEAASIYGSLSGMEGRGPASLLGPAVTGAWETATGKSPATGRPLFGLNENDMGFSPGYGMLGLWKSAKDKGRLGTGATPYMKLAAEALGGYLTEPVKASLRYGLDLGSSPAAYTEEDTRGAAWRAAARMAAGFGTRRISPAAEAAAKTSDVEHQLPDIEPIARPKRAKKGRL